MSQNSAVRLIEKIKKHDHITEARKNLHWLPIPARIKYKLLTTTWKAKYEIAPKYLVDLIKPKHHTRVLRSSTDDLLEPSKARIKNNWGTRAFQHAGPALWNELPEHVKNKPTLDSFKKGLKTHLFQKYYTYC